MTEEIDICSGCSNPFYVSDMVDSDGRFLCSSCASQNSSGSWDASSSGEAEKTSWSEGKEVGLLARKVGILDPSVADMGPADEEEQGGDGDLWNDRAFRSAGDAPVEEFKSPGANKQLSPAPDEDIETAKNDMFPGGTISSFTPEKGYESGGYAADPDYDSGGYTTDPANYDSGSFGSDPGYDSAGYTQDGAGYSSDPGYDSGGYTDDSGGFSEDSGGYATDPGYDSAGFTSDPGYDSAGYTSDDSGGYASDPGYDSGGTDGFHSQGGFDETGSGNFDEYNETSPVRPARYSSGEVSALGSETGSQEISGGTKAWDDILDSGELARNDSGGSAQWGEGSSRSSTLDDSWGKQGSSTMDESWSGKSTGPSPDESWGLRSSDQSGAKSAVALREAKLAEREKAQKKAMGPEIRKAALVALLVFLIIGGLFAGAWFVLKEYKPDYAREDLTTWTRDRDRDVLGSQSNIDLFGVWDRCEPLPFNPGKKRIAVQVRNLGNSTVELNAARFSILLSDGRTEVPIPRPEQLIKGLPSLLTQAFEWGPLPPNSTRTGWLFVNVGTAEVKQVNLAGLEIRRQ